MLEACSPPNAPSDAILSDANRSSLTTLLALRAAHGRRAPREHRGAAASNAKRLTARRSALPRFASAWPKSHEEQWDRASLDLFEVLMAEANPKPDTKRPRLTLNDSE